MKKITVLFLSCVTALLLCSCGGPSGYNANSLENTISADLTAYCLLNYADVKNVITDVTNVENDDGYYYVKGKVTVIDEYGDRYVGKFDAEYELVGDEYDRIDLDLETPTKEN